MITSLRNPQVIRARKLSKRGLRDKEKLFLVEGVRGIREAFSAGARIESVFLEPSAVDAAELSVPGRVPVMAVSEKIMRSISQTTTPPGAIAVARYLDLDPSNLVAKSGPLAVVLDGIRDPGNLGTILRSSWAAGAGSVFLGTQSVDVYNPKVVRSSAGALFNLRFSREVELPLLLRQLGDNNMNRIAADPRGSVSYYDLDLSAPCALVFGGEASGLSEQIEDHIDSRARVPMPGGAESLNVAVTAALFLFEAARQRRQ